MIGKEVLVELLEQRLSAAKIGKILGCSDDTVLYWVRKHTDFSLLFLLLETPGKEHGRRGT